MDDLAVKTTQPAPAAMAKAMEDGMLAKASKPLWQIFLLGLTGGAYIAFGFIFFTSTQQGAPGDLPLGVTKLLGGVAFSTGLVMVLTSGSDLFTGTTMTVMPLASKRLGLSRFFTHWAVAYVANFIGSFAVAVLVLWGGIPSTNKSAWGLVILNTTMGKLHHTWFEALILGILANTLVCIAVWLNFAGRNFVDKVFGIVGPIALFVASGFEHSVANMFMLPMGWLIKTFSGDDFWAGEAIAKAGMSPADYEGITWGHIIFDNLIPVTIGNIIGGALFVGMYFWLAYRKDAVKAEREAASVAAK